MTANPARSARDQASGLGEGIRPICVSDYMFPVSDGELPVSVIEYGHTGGNEFAGIPADHDQFCKRRKGSDEKIRLGKRMAGFPASFQHEAPTHSASSVTGKTRPAKSGRNLRSSQCNKSELRAGSDICSMPTCASAMDTSLVNSTSPGWAAPNVTTFWAGLARRNSETTLVSISQPLKTSHPEPAIRPTGARSIRRAEAKTPARRQGPVRISAS